MCAWRWKHDNLPGRMRTTLSGSGCKCTHCEVSRKHTCRQWHSRCALSATLGFSTFLNFHFVNKFSSCCHAATIHHNFYLYLFCTRFAPRNYVIWSVVFTNQTPDLPDNSHNSHCVDQKLPCELSWNESGYTKAKLKTSPSVTRIMLSPCTWISALLLGVSATFSSLNSVKVGDQFHPHCSFTVSVATRNISFADLASSGPRPVYYVLWSTPVVKRSLFHPTVHTVRRLFSGTRLRLSWTASRGWRESVHHLLGKQQPRENKNLRTTKTHNENSREVHKDIVDRWEKQCYNLSGWNVVAFVRTCCDRSRMSLMFLQPSKQTEVSKLWRIQHVATLRLEMSPNVPKAAAWSAHSWPKFHYGHTRAAW